jgi:hypothetical protein
LTPKQIAALTIVYGIYKKKKKVERKVIEGIFYRTTGKKLGKKYYTIPIVRALMQLSS